MGSAAAGEHRVCRPCVPPSRRVPGDRRAWIGQLINANSAELGGLGRCPFLTLSPPVTRDFNAGRDARWVSHGSLRAVLRPLRVLLFEEPGSGACWAAPISDSSRLTVPQLIIADFAELGGVGRCSFRPSPAPTRGKPVPLLAIRGHTHDRQRTSVNRLPLDAHGQVT